MAQKQENLLRKALEKERTSLRAAKDELATLQSELDRERSSVRVLRRDIASQIKRAKEEEDAKFTDLIEQLKTKMAIEHEEALKMQKEATEKALTAEFQRHQQARETEHTREAAKREDDLRKQLKDALLRLQELNSASTNKAATSSSACSNNIAAPCGTTQNSAVIEALRAKVKKQEQKIQELLEAERHNAEEVRKQYDEHLSKETELQKQSRLEVHRLLEKLKSKDRTIEQLEKEIVNLKGRIEVCNRSPYDYEKPGEPPRFSVKKRLHLKTTGLPEMVRARCGRITETNTNESSDQLQSCDNTSNLPNQNIDINEPEEEEKDKETTIKEENDEKECNLTETKDNKSKDKSSIGCQSTDGAINSWSKSVGIETLYQVVIAEHQELQRTHQALTAKLKAEQKAHSELKATLQKDEKENPINLALVSQIQELTTRQAELVCENQELREQNDLLEFRLLEMDSAPSSLHFKSSPSSSPETRGERETDDISDSGVLSLPTSEDISEADFHDLTMEPSNREVKQKLQNLCQSMENISDRISIQQGLTLLRHYEARLEAALATICQETIQGKYIPSDTSSGYTDSSKSQSRIIATVLPFTDLSHCNGKQKDHSPVKKLLKEADCLQESGIFEDSPESPEVCSRWTQTDWSPGAVNNATGDLSQEIRKLKQIRERIEEQGGNKRLLKYPGEEDQRCLDMKELVFYKERVETLESKLAIYESSGDEQNRKLNARLEREVLLSAQIKHLKERCKFLEELNKRLEEEKCEYEEAENDTRLRCQKLEVKLSALGEKKSDLQVQLQQNARTLSNLKSCLAEEEKKRIEARQHASKMESLVQRYEQRNFELEEKEMDARCRIQMIEGAIPALLAWNTFKTAEKLTSHPASHMNLGMIMAPTQVKGQEIKAKQLYDKLKGLENCLSMDCQRLQHSMTLEDHLRHKIQDLECVVRNYENGLTGKQKDEICAKLQCLSKEKLELEAKVKDLELRESYYKQTLQHADEMWACIEGDYKQQIKDYECKLEEKRKELCNVEALVRKLSSEKELKNQIQDRLCTVETEMKELRFKLGEKELEKKSLEKEERRLCCELQTANEELNYMKNFIEPSLKAQLEEYKKMCKELKKDVERLELERKTEIEDRYVEKISVIVQTSCSCMGDVDDDDYVTPPQTPQRRDSMTQTRQPLLNLGLETNINPDRAETESPPTAVEPPEQTTDPDSESSPNQTPEPISEIESQPESETRPNLEPEFGDEDPSEANDQNDPPPVEEVASEVEDGNVAGEEVPVPTPDTHQFTSEDMPEPSEPPPPSNKPAHVVSEELIKPTFESLFVTLKTQHSQIISKDQLIQCLADELRHFADSGIDWTAELMDCIATYPSRRTIDFDCALLADYLKGCCYYRRPEEKVYERIFSEHPFSLTSEGAMTFDSLLISWKVPDDITVCGFDIYVNDELVERTRDPEATRALLHPINMQQDVLITLCALDVNGKYISYDAICVPPMSVPYDSVQSPPFDYRIRSTVPSRRTRACPC